MLIRSLRFRNFKGLRDYQIALRQVNVLVGPNNAGKSSVLDALRILAAAVRFARRRNPVQILVRDRVVYGYDIPISTIPVSLVNVHFDSDYEIETSIRVELPDKSAMQLTFLDGPRCIFNVVEDDAPRVNTASQFKKRFPIDIFPFPTLGPLEEEEEYLRDETVDRNRGTRRSHRVFRNIWFRQPELFPGFKKMVETSWPGVSISPPARFGIGPAMLEMFCNEGRKDREVSWTGFGYQVWLQLLTHLVSASEATALIVDEPEIYLHPDLQRRLFELLRASGRQVVLATHSAEIINDAERDEVVIVNRSRRHAKRIGEIEGLQEALFTIGSAQNIHLTKLSRGRRVLFLEGQDYRLLRRFAARLDLAALADGSDLTIVPIGGFAQRQRIEEAAWTFGQVLKAEISIAALLDRDYRPAEEIDEIIAGVRATVPRFHVLGSKEIENYLLIPYALAKAAAARLRERGPDPNVFDINGEALALELLERCTNGLRADVQSQLLSHRVRYFAKSGLDPATLMKDAINILDVAWFDLNSRLRIVPGKQALSALNTLLQTEYGISITAAQIISHMRPSHFPQELQSILLDLNAFAQAS